ncbi:Oidioi.mRNA.OKI2018_I69.PAR.g8454.t1.cds [Oikopleura dioica]|uniref:Oidioi.mRNA.OKI2018_I69.PAR.g8454.t1.cds n=1 Tax=Oikopleura dioica TaxID=34765 RepID=A0ABN7RK95_OIKDI|nr:Oidioi.mRNA.OKI2018_I69.PAR.g8454.t1.cds [Oikopleura dioica]
MQLDSLQKKYEEALDELTEIEEKERAKKKEAKKDPSKAKIEELTKILEMKKARIKNQSKSNVALEKKHKQTTNELKKKNSEVLNLNEKLKSSEENLKIKNEMIVFLKEKTKIQQESIESLQKQREEEASRDQHSIENKNSIIQGLRKALKDEKESKKAHKDHLVHLIIEAENASLKEEIQDRLNFFLI